ncbi:hypothetical protein LAZ67_20001212 [Cordylochernes scorpioides]|uniref:Ankyrin repeat protein n=1 Tax=Cordylochernes scorpioides TaxID=51811 RepID=A0ABY6LK18_9ARAC|nr:hypothetical protein LAZ67_20001212 [Cordylochernes scorpioides]
MRTSKGPVEGRWSPNTPPNDKSYLHLIQAGASLNSKDHNGDTPLHFIIRNGYLEISRELIKNGADIHAINLKNMSILITAVTSFKNLDFIRNLLELGVEVDFKDSPGRTALHLTTMEWFNPKRGELMKLLIEFGADVNSRCMNGNTPLMNIALNGKIFEAQILIKSGASIIAEGNYKLNALHHAIEGNHIEMTKFLINSGANVNSKDSLGRTPLHLAAKKSNINMLKILVEAKADIYLKDNKGMIPLAYALQDNSSYAWEDEVSGLKYLLQETRDFDLNQCFSSGSNHSKSIKMMVKYFALHHPISSIPSALFSEEMLSSW